MDTSDGSTVTSHSPVRGTSTRLTAELHYITAECACAEFRFTRIIALARLYGTVTAQNRIIQALYCVNQTLHIRNTCKIHTPSRLLNSPFYWNFILTRFTLRIVPVFSYKIPFSTAVYTYWIVAHRIVQGTKVFLLHLSYTLKFSISAVTQQICTLPKVKVQDVRMRSKI